MENKKLIIVVTVCLVLAGVITYCNVNKSTTGIESLKRGTIIWVKCSNENCEAEYQIDSKDFFVVAEKYYKPMERLRIPCRDCGELSACRAVKCEDCGLVFFCGSVYADFEDRCPECGYSETEELKKTYGNK